jgi:phage shock protein PspC (stress-responsive transcriptional regulator)
MQKVVTINLNGNAYQLDEEGYAVLHAYLERAQARLQANPDRAEILSDIEQSIAEKCARYLGPRKTVVSAAEVDAILAEMGPVESAEPHAQQSAPGASGKGTGSTGTGSGTSAGTSDGASAPKRLYQIREGAMLTGVCKGIAAYLDIDVTLIRIIFVVLAFATFGIAVLGYAVLAFVIPYADTTEAHAAAYGLSATAQGLVDQAKRHHESFRARHAWRHEWQHRTSNRHWRRRYREMEEQMRAATQNAPMPPPMNYATSAILGVTTPIFAVIHAAVFVAWAYAMLSVLTTGTIFGWRIPIAGMPVWGSLVILVVLYAMLTGPMRAIRHIGYEHRFAHQYSPFGALHGLLWLGFTLLFAWLAYQHIPQAHALIDSLPDAWHHTGGLNVEALMHRLDLDRLIARQ